MFDVHLFSPTSAPIKSEYRISNSELRMSKLPRAGFFTSKFDIGYSAVRYSLFFRLGPFLVRGFGYWILEVGYWIFRYPIPHCPFPILYPIICSG